MDPAAALLALIATLIFGVRYDSRERERRAYDLRRMQDREAQRKARRGHLEEVHEEITAEAEADRINPSPSEADVDEARRKIKTLWRKLKMRGRL